LEEGTNEMPTGILTLRVDNELQSLIKGCYAPANNTLVSFGATITIASPGVVSLVNAAGAVIPHGLAPGMNVVFTTTGSLPTGITAGTTYYVITAGYTPNAFQISATPGTLGAAVNTSVSQSGNQSITISPLVPGPLASLPMKLNFSELAAYLTTQGATLAAQAAAL
jgi:hypothetical protein